MNTLIQECICKGASFSSSIINEIPVQTCIFCESIHQIVEMTKEEYFDYYRNGYYSGDYTRTLDDELQAGEKRLSAYKGFLRGRVLDVGCGLGGFVDILRANNYDCWGQDITSHSNEETTYRGELKSINFPTDYFQTVTLHDVLEHIIDPLNFLKEVFRLTKQEGHVLVDFPDFFDPNGQKHWRRTQHLWMFNKDQLLYFFSEVGFLLVKVEKPIPGKVVYYLRKPKQKRTKILLPPGIGDIYWVLTKFESFLAHHEIDLPDVFIQEQGVKNRGLGYLERFPFLCAKDYQPFLHGRPSEFAEAYKMNKETVFRNVLGCDWFLAFNGPMRFDKSLYDIHPEYKVDWYPRMFVPKEEAQYGRQFLDSNESYVVGYFSSHKMYMSWLIEFGEEQIAEAFRIIYSETGFKFVLVGSSWDLNGPASRIHELLPDITIDLVNKTSLTQLYGLFKYSQGVIGFPSGITITSVSLGIPTTMIWNRYFRRSFWKNACAVDAWNRWYKALDSRGLSPNTLANTFFSMPK